MAGVTGCSLLKPGGGGGSSDPTLEGLKAFRHKNYDAADKAYASVGEHDPQYVNALVYRGRIAAIHGDIAGGLVFMKRAEAVNAVKFNKDQNPWYHSVYARYLTQTQIDTPEDAERIAGDGKLVVTLDWHGALTAWDRGTTHAAWSQSLHTKHDEHDNDDVVVLGGTVYAIARSGSANVELVAFGLESGKEQWRAPLDKPGSEVRIATSDSAIFVSGGAVGKGGRSMPDLRAFDRASGRALWTHPIGEHGEHAGPLAVGNGRVVFRDKSGELTALRATDGKTLWSVGLPPKFEDDRPVFAGDTVLLATNDGALYALDASDKTYDRPLDRVRWQLPGDRERGARSFPTVTGDVVVIAGRRGLGAYDLATGAPKWTRPIKFFGTLPATIPDGSFAQGNVVVAKLANGVVAVDADGNVRWIFQNLFSDRGSDRDDKAEPGWLMGPAAPFVTDDGVWVAVKNSTSTHTLHFLPLAPQQAY